MAKELPYFKFFVSEWILGRISDYPDKVQGAFLIAICHYWNKKCEYSVFDFEKKIGKKRFKLLSELNFFEVENEMIYISFLNEQYADLSGIQQSRIKGGLARAEQVHKHKGRYKDIDKEINKDKDIDKDKKKEYDFLLPEFVEIFFSWMNYKTKRKEKYASIESEKLFYSKLLRLSNNDPETALKIINESMSNNWAGIFELKENNQNGTKQPNNNRFPTESVGDKRTKVITLASQSFDRLANLPNNDNQSSNCI